MAKLFHNQRPSKGKHLKTNRRLLLELQNWPTSATNLPEQASIVHQTEPGLQVFHH